jgi:hypothetical protein
MMRIAFAILLFFLACPAHGREWKSDLFHCAANIPDGNGWQMIEAPQTPGIAAVLAMRNADKQSVFGINVIEKYRDASISDPAVQKELEAMLRQFGYRFIGHSTVRSGTLDWLQYPVRAGTGAQQISGVIRYTSAGGYLFSITMLQGGGTEAAQDAELQQAAASFRVLPPAGVAAIPPNATAQSAGAKRRTPVDAASNGASKSDNSAASATGDNSGDGNGTGRLFWIVGAVLVVLVAFSSIVMRKPSQGR